MEDLNKSKKILIVEDSPTQAEQLKYILEMEGYQVSVAHNGKEALALISKSRPTAVISDIVMPEMDGYQLCRQIKADKGLKAIPVILLTSLSDPSDVLKALQCGADNFLTKPYDERYLLSRVQYCLINQDLRSTESISMGLEVFFQGQKVLINSDGLQILNLLLSTYEAAVQKNNELTKVQEELKRVNRRLEEKVEDRTVLLKGEIIERKRGEEALQSSEANLRKIIEKNSDGIVILDRAGVVRFINPAAETLLGFKAGDLMGELFGFPVAAGGTTEIEVIRRGGETRVAEMCVVEIDWEGERVHLASLRDITERKKMIEIQEHDQKEQMKLKDQFLSHVSHELRSPLSVIHQFVTILLDRLAGDLNAQQNEFLEITLQNVDQLRTMIDDLLEVTGAGTGKLTFEPRVISIAEVVAESLGTFQRTSIERGVILLADIPGVLPLIFADPQRLRQILINLIGNAVKFTPKGGTITVRAQVFDQDPSFLCLTVADTGCGINSDDIKKIFDRLFQGSNIIDNSRKGLGLGLYICKELVSLHGGQIWAGSQTGEGSTFSFTLPIFSLAKLFVSTPKDLLTGPMALIAVEIFPAGKPLLMGDDELIIQEVRNVLKHCILLDRDVLLPRVSSPKFGENFLIVACTDKKGAEALVRRIRGQITYCEGLQNTQFHTTISFTMMNIPPKCNAMPWVYLAKYIFNSIEGKKKNGRIKEEII